MKARKLKDIEQVSNDFSEGLPVTKKDLKRLVEWERKNSFELNNRINALKDEVMKAIISDYTIVKQ